MIAALMITVAGVALSNTQPAPAPVTVAPKTMSGALPAAAPKERRYCTIDTRTGSRILRKTCKTRGEWMDLGFDPLAPAK